MPLSYMSLFVCFFIHSLLALNLPHEVRIRDSRRPHIVEDIVVSETQIQHNNKRQMSTFGVTGVQSGRSGDGSVPLRLEIRQLQQNADQWNLYLLALDRLQNVNQTEQLSWYQISGIHGRPYVAWDNVEASPGDENSGYCTHSSILFPTWHRPYLALYEQVLYSLMQQIVGEFPAGSDRDRYSTAASTFRIPYWDWAAAPPSGQSVLPASVGGSATVQVTAPTGTTTIKNPLFSYSFHPLDPNQLPDSPVSLEDSIKTMIPAEQRCSSMYGRVHFGIQRRRVIQRPQVKTISCHISLTTTDCRSVIACTISSQRIPITLISATKPGSRTAMVVTTTA